MDAQTTPQWGNGRLRVLVVDDSELFRTGLQTLLASEAFEVAGAESGEAALEQVCTFVPDVVVMDMSMPGMSGSEATRRILQDAPGTFVMMLTGSEGADVIEAVRAGASGYLLKTAELRDIVEAIRATAAGMSAFAPQVAGALVAIARESAVAAPSEERTAAALSARERQVLALVVSGCNNVEIANRLHVSPSTVKNQVSGMLVKLGVENRVQAACVAIRQGLVDDAVAPGLIRLGAA
jgi:DNA-binding NarL/FixJ family response regulator